MKHKVIRGIIKGKISFNHHITRRKPLHSPKTSIYKRRRMRKGTRNEKIMQFEEICRENYARIYNYILAKTANKETAEDITQDVFMIAFQKGNLFLSHEKPVAFLYVTARNLILEYYKKTKESPAGNAPLDESKITAFERDVFEELCLQKSDMVDEENYRQQGLQKLKPKERDLYRKYYIDQKPMKAIAEEYHISETAVRMKYVRIRKKVQKIAADLKLDEF